MRIIGILGGVASGKSLVTQQLAELGAGVLDADKAGHEALRMPHVKAAAKSRWGDAIFDANGEIERGRLAQIVFANSPEASQERQYLEQLAHPEITRQLKQQADQLRATGTQVAVLDAALMLEAGWSEMCEKLVFVDVPPSVRCSRAVARGWTKEDFTAREGVQESLDHKRAHADVIIDNAGSPERTRVQVERLWASLIR